MTATSKTSTTTLLIITGALAIGVGLIVAALLLVSTGQSGNAPKGPFLLGSAAGLRDEVKQSPVYIADPTGGDGLWLDRLGKGFVAFSVIPPGRSANCSIRWRDSIKAYQDCKSRRYHSDQLATYPLDLRKGLLYVDTRRTVGPTASTG